MVSNSVRHPMRAEASAASHPAWPAPMTTTSKKCIPLSDTISAVAFQESPFFSEECRGVRALASGSRPARRARRRPQDRREGGLPPLWLVIRHRPRRDAGVLGEVGVPLHDQRAVSRRPRPGLPRAAGAPQSPRPRDDSRPARRQRPGRPVPQPPRRRQDARDDGRPLEGPGGPRRGCRLVARGIRGARRAAGRSAREACQGRRRGPAPVPGHGRRGRRRHPALPGVRRLPFRLRSHRAGAARGAGKHGALRERRQTESRAGSAEMISHQDACALIDTPAGALGSLLARAGELRDRGRGRTVTFSAKVFVPLTTLCRAYCGYCTFRRDPGEPGSHTMTPEEVVALAQAGARLGAKEALFSLGDKPEAAFPVHRAFLRRYGHRTTLGYLRAVCQLTLRESSLLPHANPGGMAERDLAALREVSVSMGLMLETVSERLLRPGLAHDRAPDQVPTRRLRTIALAGKLSIPFTTGILIGIGETPRERVDALAAIRDLHGRYGHLQEVIIQNFRAKPRIPMRSHAEPSLGDLLRAIAVGRLLLGPDVNIQAPPNITPPVYPRLLAAGLNDWGGISPLTPDHINPEKPWPLITVQRRASDGMGFVLRELGIDREALAEDEAHALGGAAQLCDQRPRLLGIDVVRGER